MLWGGAAYNNGILPFKNYILGEAYTRNGEPARIQSPLGAGRADAREQRARGVLAELYPMPTWHVIPPGDIFRVFERGGRNIGTQFPEIGLPNPTGSIQRLEEPGRPDLRQSNRGPGTGIRVAIPVLNIHKTRLNDPYMWFMGTNDQPGDYRHSGCAGCHVVYANDREPRHSMTYARYGRDGQTATVDPTIASLPRGRRSTQNHAAVGESGHPIRHVFTRAIPTAQCMTCHMHQPNIFLNSYLGYTMWDYESDADLMWPGPENRLPARNAEEEARFRSQHYPTAAEVHEVLERNPEGAAPRGLWADADFLREVYDRVNPLARQTQFADYHGHGWNFRAIFRRDREGNLLDADGHVVPPGDPDTFRRAGEGLFVPAGTNPGRAVHMMDIHAERGLQCADCHFSQDAHGNGFIYGEVANAIEIGCRDCHGTVRDYANLRTSGPAAPPRGRDLELIRNEDGRRRFEWVERDGRRVLIQRSIVDPNLEWEVQPGPRQRRSRLCRPAGPPATRRRPALLQPALGPRQIDGALGRRDRPLSCSAPGVPDSDLAHPDSEMACFTCHLSWTTSCGGCHLPIEANWRTTTHHYEGEETRNFATYNPQVARDDMFQLGRHMTSKGNIIAPGPLDLGADPVLDQHQPRADLRPAAADLGGGLLEPGLRAAFPAHGAADRDQATARDCHLSAANDNNAIMAQLLLQGTNFVNFVGLHAWIGLRERLRGGAGHRMGRAAGGDRLLSPALRLSRLLPAARRAEPSRADQLDARRDLRPPSLRRDPPARGIPQHRPGHRRPGRLPAESRRIYVRRRGPRRLPRLRRRQRSPTRASPSGSSPRPSRRSGQDTHVALAQRDLHGAADQPADRARAQPADGRRRWCRARTAPRCRCATPTRSRPSTRSTIMRWSPTPRRGSISSTSTRSPTATRATISCSRARHLERERRAERRPPRHARRPLRLYRRRRGPGRGRPRRSAPPAPSSPPCRSPTRAPRRSSSAISG